MYSCRDANTLVLVPSNVDGGAESPPCPTVLGCPLPGTQRTTGLGNVDRARPSGERPVGLTARHLNLFHQTFERMDTGQGETRWCLLVAI